MTESKQQLLRGLPSVSEFLTSAPGAEVIAEFGEGLVKWGLRAALEDLREGIRSGERGEVPALEELAAELRERLGRVARPEGRRAINATGILLHTGLGRAPLCAGALEALAGMGRYSLLQTDPESGGRSLREEKLEAMLAALTGCEAATVVNNNAAATMLVLNTLAGDRQVIVSRGQLVEIGGSFRMPEVMARSGAIMREVGTTNRTHLRDYERAAGEAGEAAGAILRVHTSNYRLHGFCGTPGIAELCELGRRLSVPVVEDLGSGALVQLGQFGLADEPLVADSISAGVEAVCFSGDKLVCGPQAGIICGRRETVERIRGNPLARAFRTCKLTLAALEATLVHFLNGDYREAIPFYRALSRPLAELEATAARLASLLAGLPGAGVSVRETTAFAGGGALPDQGVPSRAVALAPGKPGVDLLARGLRTGTPAVFGRISDEGLLLDVRTLFDEDLDAVAARLREVLG
jgi:L-seryl-tRNA(Ser) seleniumtransferase